MRKSLSSFKKQDGTVVRAFSFTVGTQAVCEDVYLRIIGLNKANSTMWKSARSKVFQWADNNSHTEMDIDEIIKMISMKKAPSESRSNRKSEHATHFIMFFAMFHSSLSPNEGEENLRVVPFETIRQLRDEYYAHCQHENEPVESIAKKECFRQAWKKLYLDRKVRFTRGKGTFPTCDICNNCNDMLSLSKGNKQWSRKQREIIFKFKSAHLKQQVCIIYLLFVHINQCIL